LSRVHFEQWCNLPQIQILLLPECPYSLTKLTFHRFNIDLSNIGKYKKTKEKYY
jgi:hypothetical protein